MFKVNEIRLNKLKNSLHITFDKFGTVKISSELLRVESPSAEVQGHGYGQKKTPEGKSQIKIISIKPIGNYAINIIFDDGHNTGIYSWDYLYEICKNKDSLWDNYIERLSRNNKKR